MQTEQEFLSEYNIEDYQRPSVTVDIAAFMMKTEADDSYRRDPKSTLSLLLIKRGEHPFLGCWALPGGFLRPDETIEECALREVAEETNVTPAFLRLVGVFSEIDRDPRGRIISNAFTSIICDDSVTAIGGDDAQEAKWFSVKFGKYSDGFMHLTLTDGNIELQSVLKEKKDKSGKKCFEITENNGLAFDHAKIVASALSELRDDAKNYEAIFDFLPEKFTLTALQKVLETVTNISVLPANFRRKIADYVIETDEYTTGIGHRPAKLFKKKSND